MLMAPRPSPGGVAGLPAKLGRLRTRGSQDQLNDPAVGLWKPGGMSPVSKGRKRKPAKAGRKRQARRQVQDMPRVEQGSVPTVYLDDLPPLTAAADVERTLDRRLFTMPFSGTTIDGEEFDGLNPSDPDERALLIKGEHPELHEVLADPDFDPKAVGFSPRFHLTMHEVIANQLWDNDPPEVWQAAQRLRDQGVDRHNILHALLEVMVTHMHPVLADKKPFDTEAYRRDLDDLGRREPPMDDSDG
jgi:hypothetical protein